MKGKKILRLIIGVGLVSFGLILINQTNAQAPAILAISPLTFEITVNPGESISNVVRVSNLSDYPITTKIEAQDFTAAGETGEVVVQEEIAEIYSLAKWIKVEPETFDLESHSQKLINFTISVPSNAEPGGHYGTILASTMAGGAPGGAMVVQKVGALLLVSVTGAVKESLWLKSFEVPYFSEYGPIQFVSRFENKGTVHLKPRGFISITNWLGKEVASLPLEQNNVLPNSIRAISTTWEKHWLFGQYTATLGAIYGFQNEPLSGVATFWVIPWRISLGVFLVFVALLIFFYKSRKRWIAALRVLLKGEPKT